MENVLKNGTKTLIAKAESDDCDRRHFLTLFIDIILIYFMRIKREIKSQLLHENDIYSIQVKVLKFKVTSEDLKI